MMWFCTSHGSSCIIQQRSAETANSWSPDDWKVADLYLLLVAGEAEEEVVLFALHARLLVQRTDMVSLHLPIILVLLAAHAIPTCDNTGFQTLNPWGL